MVKLNYTCRIKDLEKIISNGKKINKTFPKLEIELINLKKRTQKGNKNLFQF